MKTKLNPRMNTNPFIKTYGFLSAAFENDFDEYPLRYPRYAGIMGNTQGDRNDAKPAVNARAIEMSPNLMPCLNLLRH
jgi:hypothetical protein